MVAQSFFPPATRPQFLVDVYLPAAPIFANRRRLPTQSRPKPGLRPVMLVAVTTVLGMIPLGAQTDATTSTTRPHEKPYVRQTMFAEFEINFASCWIEPQKNELDNGLVISD